MVVALEFVDEVVDLGDRLARHDPERDRLAAAAVLLSCVPLREGLVRRLDGAGVGERLTLPLLPKNLVDHPLTGSPSRQQRVIE